MEILVRICPIIFVLSLCVTAQVLYILDRADDAFDDQYIGCTNEMDQSLESNEVLAQEKQQSKVFRRAWDEAETIWYQRTKKQVKSNLPQGFQDHHGIAVVAYSGFISKSFNDELRSAGKSHEHYMENFHFKSLHYYLTAAFQLLSHRSCYSSQHLIYEDFHGVYFKPPNESGTVRFGQFVSALADESHYYSNETFFLNSSFAVSIQNFSQFPEEKSVVVPGYEVFRVEPGEDKATFSLSSTGKKCSKFNCAYLRGNASIQTLDRCVSNSGAAGSFSVPWAIYFLVTLCQAAVLFLFTF